MPNEELIYRITRAVYDRLGAVADESTVEQLVTDIYREVEPELRNDGMPVSSPTATGSAGQLSERAGAADRLIVSVFGVDHPGIVAGVSQILADAGCSIVDINQTVVQGKFAMVSRNRRRRCARIRGPRGPARSRARSPPRSPPRDSG